MTVPITVIKNRYNGNDSTTVWPYIFKIFDDSQIRAIIADADDNQTELVLDTDFSVSGAGDEGGGNVTYPISGDPLPATWTITLAISIPLSQLMDLHNQGAYYADTQEAAFDKLTKMLQQQQEELDRCPKVTITSGEDGSEYMTQIIAARNAAQAAQAAAEVAQTASETAQTAAELAETNAETAETNAETAETNAAASAVAAGLSETAAGLAQTAAELAETNAETAQTAAELAKTGAETAETNAETAQTAAELAETNAGIAKTAAETAQTAAETAQTAAELAQTNAETAETNAAASAVEAANQAAALTGSSVSSVAIATGSKSFTTQADKQFSVGRYLLITSDADPTDFMFGQVTAYAGTALTVDVQAIGGSGTHADWTIALSGVRGATGATGAAGSIQIADAAGTVDAITADYTPDLTLSDKVLAAFVATGANTITTPTFAPDGLTAHNIVKMGGQVLAPGDIPAAGFVALVEYNLANTRWELINPANSGNVLRVGVGEKYNTITAAMAIAVAGDTISVGKGTYTEKVTYLQDNIVLKAVGSAENTIINAPINDVCIDFSIRGGCTLEGFTVNQTSINANADYCIFINNNNADDYTTIKNCIISVAVTAAYKTYAIRADDGNVVICNNRISITNNSTSSQGVECVYLPNAAHTYYVHDNEITINDSGTGAIYVRAIESVAVNGYIRDNIISVSAACTTIGLVMGIESAGGYIIGNKISAVTSSTGNARGINTYGGSTIYIIGNHIHGTTSNSDAYWIYNNGTVYAKGNIVTGDGDIVQGTFYGEEFHPDGEITKPSQPTFLVHASVNQNNLPINTETGIVFGTEVFDIGNNFAANVFTAPVTGKYLLTVGVLLLNIDVDTDYYELRIITSNRKINQTFDPGVLASDPAYWNMGHSVVCDMDAGDTADVRMGVGPNGVAQTDLLGDASDSFTYFSGQLIS